MAEKVTTKTPGSVWRVLVAPGDTVAAGDVLFILEVMKVEMPHSTAAGGTVEAVHIAEQESVDGGIVAVEIA